MDALHITLALALAVTLLVCVRLLLDRSRLSAENDLARARLADEERLKTGFQAVAGEVLASSNAEFLRLAKETLSAREGEALAEMDRRRQALDALVRPIQKAVEKTHHQLRRQEKDQAGLREQVLRMNRGHQELRAETGKLVQALRKPNVRGRYGEIQLERVVELAGMKSYCDFTPQENLRDDEGRLQKPDLVVRLPNGRFVAVDAKTSIDAYLDALDAGDEAERERLFTLYAQNVLEQVQKLAKKQYWTNFPESPEMVVMFVPGDQLVDTALEHKPELIELAAERNIVIASPSTLIGLLRAVHVGWRERNLTDSAEELFALGRELHERAAIVLERASKFGESLDTARRHYNAFVGSVQSRLVPALRRFEDRDVRSARELNPPRALEGEARALEVGELLGDATGVRPRGATKEPVEGSRV